MTCDKAPEGQSEGKTYASPPPASLSENATWEATIHTTCGDIRVELDGNVAPQTVASFIYLARDELLERRPLPPAHHVRHLRAPVR